MERAWKCPDCGVAMTEQPRQPSGVPVGGQFAAATRGEADVALRPLDGTFMFPPPLRTADEIIDFWSRVEIPDEVLARTRQVYRANRESLKVEWQHHAWSWDAGWRWNEKNPPPPQDDPGAYADWEGRQRVAQNEYETALIQRLQDIPDDLERSDIRPLFRASAMLRHAVDADLDFAEHRRVQDYLLEFSDGARQVGEAATQHGLVGLGHRFVYPDNYDKDGDGLFDPPTAPAVTMSADFDWERHKAIVNDAVRDALGEHEVKLDQALNEIYSGITGDIATSAALTEAGFNAQFGVKTKKPRWSER